MSLPVPGWFERALAVPFTDHMVDVAVPVHYVRWGAARENAPSVILIHGGGAHAFWWGYLGPMLTETHDVVALDLSGHGDSGRRDSYPREVWTEDVLAVMSHAGFTTRPVLVGHSMGGFVSMAMASLHGDKLAGAILVDSPVRPPADGPSSASPKRGLHQGERPLDPPPEPQASRWTFQSMKPHADLATAVERFRPLPEQPTPYPYLLDYVARRSVREAPEGGFAWKFDPRVFERASRSSLRSYLGSAQCRLALIRGELSLVLPRETAEYMVSLVKDPVPLIDIPEGYHHLMFDQPLPFLVALRTLLADWHAHPRP